MPNHHHHPYKIKLLALLFGTGSWIAIAGLWLEIPLLIDKLPERWALASHLNIAIQLANIGPLIYWLGKRLRVLNDINTTHLQLTLGIVACFVLIFFWDLTVWMFNQQHSIILLVGTFFLALVDCTSSVTFLPFMARFDCIYLTPYLVGEGLSGFISTIFALAQGVNEQKFYENELPLVMNIAQGTEVAIIPVLEANQTAKVVQAKPRFSVSVYFTALLATVIVSYGAFLCLQYLPLCKREMKRHRTKTEVYDDNQNVATVDTIEMQQIKDVKPSGKCKLRRKPMTSSQRRLYYYLLVLMFWCCFTTFGFMPSVQPYSATPYGVTLLHNVVIMAGLAYPAGCFLGMFVERRSTKSISILTLIGTLFASYIIVCATMSPRPPLHGTTIGGLLMLACWILYVVILSYAKTMITLVICDLNSSTGMFWVGMQTQLGAALGALFAFLLVDLTEVFHQT